MLSLLPDWETSNVDFKRELHLETSDDKAEFVRDVLGLVNPRITGARYLVIGWDPVSHEFTTSVDPRVTQDRIEDLLAHYTQPTVTARYRVFDWDDSSLASVIEIVRDRKMVPYRVRARLAGAKRTIEVGDVYTRRGSHVTQADDEEIAGLEAEAIWAREHE